MFEYNNDLKLVLESSGVSPLYKLELRPKRSLPKTSELKIDLDFESAKVGNILPNSVQEEETSVSVTRFVRGEARPYATEFTTSLSDSRIKLSDGIAIDGSNVGLSETFSVVVYFMLTELNSDAALLSLCLSSLAGNQRRFEIGLTNDAKAYAYVNGDYEETGSLGQIDLNVWHTLFVSYTTTGLGSNSAITFRFNNGSANTVTFTGNQISDGGDTFADGVNEFIIGAAKSNTSYTNNFYGRMGKVLLWDGIALSDSERLEVVDFFSPPIVAHENIISFSGINGQINPISRVHTVSEWEVVLSDDQQLRILNENYALDATECCLFVEFDGASEDSAILLAYGLLNEVIPDGPQLRLSIVENRPLAPNSSIFNTYYVGHPGEILKELFRNFRFPRFLFNTESLAFDYDSNFSHLNSVLNTFEPLNMYWINKATKEVIKEKEHAFNPYKFLGYYQEPSSVQALIENLLQGANATLIYDQYRKLKLKFYDTTDTSVKTLTNDDVLEFRSASTFGKLINQIKVSGGAANLSNTDLDESFVIFAENYSSQVRHAAYRIHKKQINAPDFQSLFHNAFARFLELDPGPPYSFAFGPFPGFSGLGLSVEERTSGGTQEASRAVGASNLAYFAIVWVGERSPEEGQYPQTNFIPTNWLAEIIEVDSLTGFPDWTVYQTYTRRIYDETGTESVVSEIFPTGLVTGTASERGVFNTPQYPGGIEAWVFDCTSLVLYIKSLLNRFGNGAATCEIVLPLRYMNLEEGDIVKLHNDKGMWYNNDTFNSATSLDFEIISKRIDSTNKVTLTLVQRGP